MDEGAYWFGALDQLSLLERPWRHLVILDACRWGYFTLLYKKWISRDFYSVASSPAFDTINFLKRAFPGWYEVEVYSAHPFLNSRGFPIEGWVAKDHFTTIYDVWRIWDPEEGTCPPSTVVDWVERKPPEGRSLIWFVQPHWPWIGSRLNRGAYTTPLYSQGCGAGWEVVKMLEMK